MGLFDKRKKVSIDEGSGLMFTFAITYQNQGQIARSNLGVDGGHMLAVNAGYLLGMSMLFIARQIGLEKVDEFINLSMENAKKVLAPALLPLVPEMKIYTEKASNYVLKEAANINGDRLFDELADRYLKDLFNNGTIPMGALPIAKQDMLFFYNNINKIVSGIKIVK